MSTFKEYCIYEYLLHKGAVKEISIGNDKFVEFPNVYGLIMIFFKNIIHCLNQMKDLQSKNWNYYIVQLQLGFLSFFYDTFSPKKLFYTPSHTQMGR